MGKSERGRVFLQKETGNRTIENKYVSSETPQSRNGNLTLSTMSRIIFLNKYLNNLGIGSEVILHLSDRKHIKH